MIFRHPNCDHTYPKTESLRYSLAFRHNSYSYPLILLVPYFNLVCRESQFAVTQLLTLHHSYSVDTSKAVFYYKCDAHSTHTHRSHEVWLAQSAQPRRETSWVDHTTFDHTTFDRCASYSTSSRRKTTTRATLAYVASAATTVQRCGPCSRGKRRQRSWRSGPSSGERRSGTATRYSARKCTRLHPRWNVTCARGWQGGGGLYIGGTATLINTNVYDNRANKVRWPFELSLNFHAAPH